MAHDDRARRHRRKTDFYRPTDSRNREEEDLQNQEDEDLQIALELSMVEHRRIIADNAVAETQAAMPPNPHAAPDAPPSVARSHGVVGKGAGTAGTMGTTTTITTNGAGSATIATNGAGSTMIASFGTVTTTMNCAGSTTIACAGAAATPLQAVAPPLSPPHAAPPRLLANHNEQFCRSLVRSCNGWVCLSTRSSTPTNSQHSLRRAKMTRLVFSIGWSVRITPT